jgi:hypothetical protein
MFNGLLGPEDVERILLFIMSREKGYGREIARYWHAHQTGIQRQLERLEVMGVLSGEPIGRTHLYTWNPRYPYAAELKGMLAKAISLLPDDERSRLTMNRRRPRRIGKPL